MENDLNLFEPIPKQAKESKFRTVMLIVSFVIALASLAGVALLYAKNGELQTASERQQTLIDDQKSEITAIRKSAASFKETAAKIVGVEERTFELARGIFILYMQHDMEGGVVTDDFTVEKLSLDVQDNGKLSITIDVDNQPQMSLLYNGQGSYELADRELRAKSTALIRIVKARYLNSFTKGLPEWNDKGVFLTVKNYEIGDTRSGTFTLAGDKK
ncbi:hypothetical protein [Cohnella abietis]|uniref:Uncharacterized protein n=1 Tax=Cohnella abietis TaxID=2507935 RepID=A0A3T1DAJ7_9BACL|nr:hypothetical protein [Cohnella abietis]BBI35105.1 hypothetical protein KCTCHS21_45040 [Cohnella abietis]